VIFNNLPILLVPANQTPSPYREAIFAAEDNGVAVGFVEPDGTISMMLVPDGHPGKPAAPPPGDPGRN
jgi:hypothetical protein